MLLEFKQALNFFSVPRTENRFKCLFTLFYGLVVLVSVSWMFTLIIMKWPNIIYLSLLCFFYLTVQSLLHKKWTIFSAFCLNWHHGLGVWGWHTSRWRCQSHGGLHKGKIQSETYSFTFTLVHVNWFFKGFSTILHSRCSLSGIPFFQFNPESPVSPQDEGYRSNPSLQDRTYCLVYVLPADKISLTVNNDDDEVTKKIKYIKNKANELGEYKSKKMSEIFIIFIIAKSKISFMRLNDIVPRFIITSVTGYALLQSIKACFNDKLI